MNTLFEVRNTPEMERLVDESTMTGSLKALTGEVKAVVCAVLDMTDEELEDILPKMACV